MIQFGMLTSPRKVSTLNNTIRSLRRIYSGRLRIFAEPGEYGKVDGELMMNKEKLGCFRNFDNALRQLMDSPEDYICVLSDDLRFTLDLFKHWKPREDGYSALYTPLAVGNKYNLPKGWSTINEGWAGTWGGAYVFHKSHVEKILNHEFYKDHLENYEKNQQIDHCIPEVCFQLNINQYFHNPSLIDHVGYHSTIGHRHTNSEIGFNFR